MITFLQSYDIFSQLVSHMFSVEFCGTASNLRSLNLTFSLIVRKLSHTRVRLSVIYRIFTLKALSHDGTLRATLHATTELLRVTGFAGVAGNVSCNVPKVEIVPTSATLHVSLQMAVTLIATFARSVACNRFIV